VTNERVDVTRTVDGVTVRAKVSPEFADMAETVLHVMTKDGLGTDPETEGYRLEKGIDRLRRETPMWWGFAEATPRAVADGYELVTPDFLADPPIRTDDLTPMLDIRDKMQQVALDARVGEVPTRANERVLLTRGWEHTSALVMIRDEPRPGDSGWFIQDPHLPRPEGEWATDDLVAVEAWTLLRDRPELVWAMSLPVGYLVATEPGRIIEVADETNAVVLRDVVL
jgi:hypothetical protein